ncbi:MAG: hypothetical protein N2Z69_05260 [Methylophilaceae bacterium]|nr:hypothetical protein [Methylophilaceae bacterium]
MVREFDELTVLGNENGPYTVAAQMLGVDYQRKLNANTPPCEIQGLYGMSI